MGLGVSLKNQITAILKNEQYRSTCTITSKTITLGSRGGYEANTETSGSAVTVYCIPSDYIFYRDTPNANMGIVNSGSISLLIPQDTTVGKDDSVSYNSITWVIDRIEKINFNDETIAIELTLSHAS